MLEGNSNTAPKSACPRNAKRSSALILLAVGLGSADLKTKKSVLDNLY